MESRTKNRQSAQTILRMVESAFGAAEVPTASDAISEFDQGWFNAVYRVRLRSGRSTVLKIAPPRAVRVLTYERGLMDNELAALDVLGRQTSVPVPVPAVEFADVDGSIAGAPWFFMSDLPGRDLAGEVRRGCVTPNEHAALMEQIGEVNRALNAITGDRFGGVGRAGSTSWSATFEGMVRDLFEDGRRARAAVEDLESRALALVGEHAPTLDEVVTPRFVSWDLWPGNVLVENGRITGLVDHERALWGDPLMEAGFMGADVPIYPDGDAFVRGYGQRPGSRAERVRRRLYSLHLLLVMTIEPLYRGPQDPRQSEWSRERLASLIADLEHCNLD